MMKLKANKPFSKTLLTSAIAMSLSGVAVAADYPVTEISDDGTGLIANTLSWAIKQANTNPGTDTISLHTDVILFGVMKRLIDSDVTIQSDGSRRTINGGGKRPFFIKSGDVTIQSVDITNSAAIGGSSETGGQGAGMGGAVFIYDGNVTINDVTIGNSSARGGIQAYASAYSEGGGGLFGDAGTQSGGGLFASGSGNSGGYGGYGAYQTTAPDFGAGGDYTGYIPGEHGGFGGGGGFPSGHGGFGGGGASIISNQAAGNGGFGAGAPYAGSYGVYSGIPGYGATMNGAAGMGGAIFVRIGQLHITDSTLSNNQAIGSADAKGLGGAIFVLHATDNSNYGTPASQQGMPAQLPTVTGCGNAFANNSAPGSTGQPDNDHDVFDLAGVAEDLTQPCPMEQNLVVTVATDNGLGDVPNTLSWAI